MALIKCPECNSDISDQAEKCPKCGYELKTPNEPEKKEKKFKGKVDYKYIILGLLIVVVGFYMLNNRQSSSDTGSGTQSPTGSTTPTPSSQQQPSSGTAPSTTPGTNQRYVIYNDTNLGVQYEIPSSYGTFTDELRKAYGDVAITIDLVQGTLGQYSVYGIQYTYTSNGHVVVDNRYATVINNKIFMIGSKEENVNQQYINDIIRVMFNTLRGGN